MTFNRRLKGKRPLGLLLVAFSLIPLKSGKRRSAGARLHVPSATYAAFPSLARVDRVRIATEDAQSIAEGVLTTESASARSSRLF